MPNLNKHSKLFKVRVVDGYDIDIPNPTYTEILERIDLDKWYYTNKKIFYKHNEYGYRADNISDITDTDYLLTFGCSYSYGTGLFYEDTYSYQVSKQLQLKNINLSIPGSGLDMIHYNTNLFVNNFINIRLPKYVIYQYPHDHRLAFAEYEENRPDVLKIINKTANEQGILEEEYIRKYYIDNSGEKYLRDFITPLYLNNIWKILGVPVIHISFDNDYKQEFKADYQTFDIENIQNEFSLGEDYIYDLARDLSHNGREFHDKVKKIILKRIKNG